MSFLNEWSLAYHCSYIMSSSCLVSLKCLSKRFTAASCGRLWMSQFSDNPGLNFYECQLKLKGYICRLQRRQLMHKQTSCMSMSLKSPMFWATQLQGIQDHQCLPKMQGPYWASQITGWPNWQGQPLSIAHCQHWLRFRNKQVLVMDLRSKLHIVCLTV